MTAHSGPRVWVEAIMGTAVSVHVRGPAASEPAIADAIAACTAELRRLEQVFSPFRADSDISMLRRGERGLDDLDPLVADVARLCADAEEATGGLFSAHRDGWFDPTGFVKGWAVERAAQAHVQPLLSHAGITAVGINAGGDLRLFTAPAADWSWNVGIADPAHPGRVIATLGVRDGAVATSGTAERGAHIVDPRTGLPAAGVRSATIVADDLTTADVWATAAVVAGAAGLDPIRRAPVRSGLVVGTGGDVHRWIAGVGVTVEPVAGAGVSGVLSRQAA